MFGFNFLPWKDSKPNAETRAHPREDPSSWLGTAGTPAAGPEVTDNTALTLPAVYAACMIIAQDIATVPFKLYERDAAGRRAATEHPLYGLLHDAPNPEMSSANFRMALQMWLGLRGNGLAEVERDNMGRPKYLWPLQTSSMQCMRINGKLIYLYTLPNGQQARLFADEVFHVRGITMDGIWGLSPIGYARENLSLGLAAQEHGARLFSNNTVPKGVIESTAKFKDEETLMRFKRQVEDAHAGLSKAHRVMILENGMQWKQTGLSPEDSQFLELKKFGVEDVARWYRIAASKLQQGDKRAFASVEQDSLDHVIFTLRPWYVLWEQEAGRTLLRESERARFYAEHSVDAFLRGDIATRFESYVKGTANGIMNLDEARDKENLPPLPNGEGKKFRVPLNLATLGEKKEPAPTPKKPATPDGAPDEPEPASSQA